MWKSNLLSITLAVMVPMAGAHADNATAIEAISLEERELQQQKQRVDDIAAAFGRYRTIRDQMFYGDNGIQKRMKPWLEKYSAWLEAWKQIVATSKRANGEDSLEFSKELVPVLMQQEANYSEIRAQYLEIIESIDKALAELANTPSYDQKYAGESYAGIMGSMNLYKANLVDNLKALKHSMSAAVVTNWASASESLRSLIDLRLKKAALQFPELAREIKVIEGQFAADAVLQPLHQEMKTKATEIREAMSKSRIFKARKLHEAFKKRHQEILAKIEASGIDPFYRKPVIEVIGHEVQQTDGQMRQTSIVPVVNYVKMNYKVSGASYKQLCSNPATSQQVNCELYRSIYKLKTEQLGKLNASDLEELESKIEKIGKGPL